MKVGDLIPELTSNFNAYYEGNCLGGVSNEMDLPELESDSDEIRGAGLMGGWNAPAVGQFGPTSFTLPFIHIYEPQFKLMDTRKLHTITLRASVQYLDPVDDIVKNRQVMVILKGRVTKAALGKMAAAAKGETELEFDLTYCEVRLASAVMLKMNKIGSEYVVDGEDIYSEIRSQI